MRRSRSISAAASAIRCAPAALLLALGACASAPPMVHLHSLMPVELAAAAADVGAGVLPSSIPIVFEPIRIPAQVDQPQWLVRLPDDSLAVLEQERWASPLRDELREALLEVLAVGYGAVEAHHSVAAAGAPMRITVDVRRFESLPGREARSEGSWSLTSAGARTPAFQCDWLIRESSPGPASALAAAHRRAVARLGAAIGAALVAMKAGQSASCPAADDRR
jgi:uncharacterized lipoprotein YmbA